MKQTSVAHDASAAIDLSMVGHVQVELAVQLGTVALSLEKLLALREGEVLAMQEALDAPVTLLLNGKPVARGELMAVEDQLGVRILELA